MAARSLSAPANDSFSNAIPVSGTSLLTNGTNVGASKQPDEPNHAGDTGGRSVWWSWNAPFSGSVVITTAGSDFDTLLAVYTGTTVSSLTLVAANDQDFTDPMGGDASRVKFDALTGTTYHIVVDGFSGASGSIVLSIGPPPRPANDNFSDSTTLDGSDLTAAGSNVDATKEVDEPDHAGEPGGHSVWWNWTPPFAGSATVATLGSDFDTVLAVHTGTALDDLSEVASNDQDPLGGDTSRVMFAARTGTRYWIAVDGWNRESGPIVLSLKLRPPPPELTNATRREDGFFEVKLRGVATASYVIERRDSFSISNAWTALATNRTDTSGVWVFHDASATNAPRRFYRGRTLF